MPLMRVLGEGSTISVGLDDDEEDALARRQQLVDLCAGAVVRPPRPSPSPSQPRSICTIPRALLLLAKRAGVMAAAAGADVALTRLN